MFVFRAIASDIAEISIWKSSVEDIDSSMSSMNYKRLALTQASMKRKLPGIHSADLNIVFHDILSPTFRHKSALHAFDMSHHFVDDAFFVLPTISVRRGGCLLLSKELAMNSVSDLERLSSHRLIQLLQLYFLFVSSLSDSIYN